MARTELLTGSWTSPSGRITVWPSSFTNPWQVRIHPCTLPYLSAWVAPVRLKLSHWVPLGALVGYGATVRTARRHNWVAGDGRRVSGCRSQDGWLGLVGAIRDDLRCLWHLFVASVESPELVNCFTVSSSVASLLGTVGGSFASHPLVRTSPLSISVDLSFAWYYRWWCLGGGRADGHGHRRRRRLAKACHRPERTGKRGMKKGPARLFSDERLGSGHAYLFGWGICDRGSGNRGS
jgi:hypothetical protein